MLSLDPVVFDVDDDGWCVRACVRGVALVVRRSFCGTIGSGSFKKFKKMGE